MAPNRAAPSTHALANNPPNIPTPKIKDLRIPPNIPNHPNNPKHAVKI